MSKKREPLWKVPRPASWPESIAQCGNCERLQTENKRLRQEAKAMERVLGKNGAVVLRENKAEKLVGIVENFRFMDPGDAEDQIPEISKGNFLSGETNVVEITRRRMTDGGLDEFFSGVTGVDEGELVEARMVIVDDPDPSGGESEQ